MLFRQHKQKRWKFSGYAHFTLFTSHDVVVVVVGDCKLWNDKKILILTLALRRDEWRPKCMSCWVWREMKLKIHNIQHSIKIHWRVNTRHNDSHSSLLCVRWTQKQHHEIAWRLRIKLGCSCFLCAFRQSRSKWFCWINIQFYKSAI